MIRPLSVANRTNFKGFLYVSDNKNNTLESTEDKNQKMENNIGNAFIAGLLLGSAFGGVSTYTYKNYQADRLIRDMAATKEYEKVDSFEIKDVKKNQFPKIVLIDENGYETVYDFKSGKIYLNEDGELIEKH